MTPPVSLGSAARPDGAGETFVDEGRLQNAMTEYLTPAGVEHVLRVLEYAPELYSAQPAHKHKASVEDREQRPTAQWDFAYGASVAQTLADAIHIDAISLAAVLLFQAGEGRLATLDEIRARLGGAFGADVARTIQNIERFDTLQRPGANTRRSAQATLTDAADARERRRSRERQRKQDSESLRQMSVGRSEEPRVAVFQIADQLRLMRAVRQASDMWLRRAGKPTSEPGSEAYLQLPTGEAPGDS